VTAPVRLAELLVAFSAVADLGMGLPVGAAARAAYVAVELARGQGLTEPEVSDVFAAALLQHIGCTAYSHEVSLLFADETVVKRTALATDFIRAREIALGYVPGLVRASAPGERLRTLRSAVLHSRRMTRGLPARQLRGRVTRRAAPRAPGRGAQLTMPARLLAAADAFHALRSPQAGPPRCFATKHGRDVSIRTRWPSCWPPPTALRGCAPGRRASPGASSRCCA